mgnify:CR=1 FL=1
MNVHNIKYLCKLQGIYYKPLMIVYCPACKNKTMAVDFRNGKGVCSVCKSETTLDDLIVIWEEDKINRNIDKIMRFNKGVGGNY